MNAGPARITRDLPAKAVKPTGRRHPRALLACGTLAVALALTACGGSGKSSSTATRSTTITSTAQSTAAPSAARSTPSPSASAANFTGTWHGNYTSSSGDDSGSLSVVFTQHGSILAGTITTDSVCFRKGSVSGTNFGETVNFVAVGIGNTGSQHKLTFKVSSRTSRNLQGSYQAVTSCGNGSGTFELGGPS